MVFSSVPLYLDPHNWPQQNPNQQGGATNDQNHHLPPLPPPPPPHVAGAGSIRPGSMADRARLAKIPQPEVALKCPRCDSTNTKFCYFNNYSLSQPRHFCKTCRRYWTRGGALRNVPVGGGCRRNKKSNKTQNNNNSNKSPVCSSERQQIMGSSNSNSTTSSSDIIMTQLNPQTNHHQLPFMTSLHNLTAQFGVGLTTDHMGFHNNSGMNTLLSGGGMQHAFFDPPTAGLFPFQTEQSSVGCGGGEGQLGSSSSRVSQLAPVKMEDNNHGLKSFLGISENNNNNNNNNNQFWSGNTWTDLSGLNSSSTTHLL